MRFLVLASHAWQSIRQRPHHLMTRFAAAGHEVIWVQPRYLRWLLRERARFFITRDANPIKKLQVRTATLMNGERLPPVRAWNKARLRSTMKGHRAASTQPTILWIYNPHEAHLAESIPYDLLIYDIMDEYRGFPWSPPNIEKEEAQLLARTDWVFAGTHALYESKHPQAQGRIECILSGVEAAHFAHGPQEESNKLAEIDSRASAWRRQFDFVIGYAGMLDLRLDQQLIAGLAREFPHWGFMLLGPHACALDVLKPPPNIYAPGAIEYADLPSYYHAWDVAWLPFVENELTSHINPTKLLEYAAAEIPIVARALPDVTRYYAEGAWLYENVQECRSILMQLAADPNLRRSRLPIARAWAQDRDWDTLASRMLERVENLLKRKKSS